MAVRKALIEIEANTDRLNRPVELSISRLTQLGRVAGQTGGSIATGLDRGTTSATSSLSNLTGGLLSAGAALSALRKGLEITSNFQRIDTAIKAVSTSSQDYAQTQNFLRTASDRYGVSIEALSKAYVGFKANTNDTILKGAEAERIFLSVAKASAALQLSTEDTTGTLRAFGQMLSKGTVQSEELKGQVGERLYGAFQMAARAMKVSTEELNKMLQSGEVMAVDLLPKLATELDKSFGKAALENVNTMAGGFTRAKDQLSLFISEFSKSAGIDTFFTKIGNRAADGIANLREAMQRGESLLTISGSRRQELTTQIKLRQQVQTSTPAQNGETLAGLMMQVNDTQNKIKNPEKFGYNEAVVNANKRLLSDLQERVQIVRREGRKVRIAADEEEAKSAKAKVGKPLLDIDVLKKQKNSLADQIANAKLNGTPFAALQAEYDRLTRQIDRATDLTKKHKVAVDSQNVGLTTNESILKRLSQRLREQGDSAPASLKQQVALFAELVRQGKELANMKPVDLGKAGTTPLEGKGNFADAFLSLTGAGAAPKLPGLAEYLKNIKEGQDKIASAKDEFLAMMGLGKIQLAQAGVGLLEGLGTALTSKNPLKSALQTILGFIGDFAIKLGAAILLAGKLETVAGLATGPFGALFALQGAAKIAAGGGLVIGGGIIKGMASTALASGGYATGPTHALIGEYPGANLAGRGEFVAPVQKGAGLIAEGLMKMGAVGGGGGTLSHRISGPDLLIWLEAAQKYNKAFGNG